MGGSGQAKPKTRPAVDAPQSAQPLKFVALVAVTALAAAALYLLPILSGHAPPGAQDGLADRLMVEAPFALAAGVTGAVLGFLVNPIFYALSAAIGAGLMWSGLSGSCMMANLLSRMPWNRAGA